MRVHGHPLEVAEEEEEKEEKDSSNEGEEDPALPTIPRVIKESDIVGQRASIIYEVCLTKLLTLVKLPMKRCCKTIKEQCPAVPPFKTKITHIGSGTVVQWVSKV